VRGTATMPSSSSTSSWQKLCEHAGLSEYEAKVYVSLVKKGACKARKLSMMCGVPRTKIYGVLKKLIERGLVIEMPEEPRKFASTSPANAFEAYLQSYEEKARDLYVVVSSLESTYEKMKEAMRPQKEEIWVIQRRSEILKKVGEMLSRAERSVNIATTENGLILLCRECNKFLDKLTEKKDLKVEIAAPVIIHNQYTVQELRYVFEVKDVEIRPSTFFLCVDDHECLLANFIPDDSNTFSDKDMAIFSQNLILCSLISGLILKPKRDATPPPRDLSEIIPQGQT